MTSGESVCFLKLAFLICKMGELTEPPSIGIAVAAAYLAHNECAGSRAGPPTIHSHNTPRGWAKGLATAAASTPTQLPFQLGQPLLLCPGQTRPARPLSKATPHTIPVISRGGSLLRAP